MKRQLFTALLAIMCTSIMHSSQTLWVSQGQVKYAFDTQQIGTMPFSHAGDSLTIQNKAFAVNDIDSIYVTDDLIEGNTVQVEYQGSKAVAIIAGNIAADLTAAISAATVSIVQNSLSQQEVFYTLSGTSSNGSFYHEGQYKATLTLNGLTLTCSSGPAININDGKRIEINLADGTTSTITDASGGTHKAAFVVEGHSEFKGAGTLILNGNTKHAFKSDEYMELKKSFTGVIKVNKAVGDGININQYLEVKSGSIIVENCEGDGIQIDEKTDTTKLNNGQLIMSGGYISINTPNSEKKGIKIATDANITDGLIEVNIDGTAINAKGNITIGGGKIYAYSASGHGIYAEKEIAVSGGYIVASAATTVGYSLRSGASALSITGGNIAAIGAFVSIPSNVTGAAPVLTYQGSITKNNFTLTDASGNAVMAFEQARNYLSSKRHTLLLTSPAITDGTTYTLNSGATLNSQADNWHGLYIGSDGIGATGTAVATGTAAAPYAAMK